MKADANYYYNNYVDEACNIIPVEKVRFWGRRALDYLSGLTCGKIHSVNEESAKIHQCIWEIAEEMYKGSERNGIKSENNDGYSVTYEDSKDEGTQLKRIAERYLGDTGLLYRGVYQDGE